MAMAAPRVEELVTCSICLDKMTRPKMLPCQHTFCLSCLIGIPRTRDTIMDCPQCRAKHTIPSGGIKAFSDNFLINSLLGILSDPVEDLVTVVSLPPEETRTCTYCEKKVSGAGLVCADCAADPRISVIENINCTLAMIKSNLSDTPTLKDLAVNHEYHAVIAEDLAAEKGKMTAKFDEMIKTLEHRKAQLNETFERGNFMHQLMRSAIGDGIRVNDFYKESSVEISALPDLTYLKLMDADLTRYLNWFHVLMEMTRSKNKLTVGFTTAGLELKSGQAETQDMKTCLGKLGYLSLGDTMFDEEVNTITPQTPDDASPDIDAAIASYNGAVAEGGSTGVKVKASGDGKKGQRERPVAPPELTLSPRSINYMSKVFKRPRVICRSDTKTPIITPTGVAYAPQAKLIIYADSRSDSVMHIRPNGSPVATYNLVGPTIKLSFPWDVSVNETHNSVVISDSGNYRIVCQDMQGNLKYVTGGQGRGKDKFLDIRGVACHRQFILAVDSDNHRVSIFRIENGEFCRNFGQKYLTSPQYVAVSDWSDVYVTDGGEVLVFDWNGRFLRKFGPREGLPDKSRISGITVDGEGYVCVGRLGEKCLDVYDNKGHHHTSIFGELGFAQPRGLALMPDGSIIVCDVDEEYNSSQLRIL